MSGSEDTTWHLWPQLWQNGGEILSADGKKAAFNSAAGLAALEFWRQLAVEDKSVYLDQTDEKYAPLFFDGRVGMMISGPWQLSDLVQRKTPYKIAPLPTTFSWGWATIPLVEIGRASCRERVYSSV